MRAVILCAVFWTIGCGGDSSPEPTVPAKIPVECRDAPMPGWDIGCETICRATPDDWDPATRSVRLRCPVCIWDDGVNRTTGSVEVGATCEQRVRGDRLEWVWVHFPPRFQ